MIGSQKTNARVRAGGIAVSVALLGLFGVMVSGDREAAVEDTQAVKGYSLDLADRTIADCSNPATTPDPATCQKAAEVKTVIEQRTVEVPAPRRTDAEVKQLIEDTLRENPDLLPRGPKGDPAEVDYDRIVQAVQERVKALIPAPVPGKDGETPVVDYDRIIREAVLQIPVPEDGQSPPCLSQPGQCMGPMGPQGEQGQPGRGIVSGPTPIATSQGCVMRTIYDQAPLQVDTPTSELNCLP